MTRKPTSHPSRPGSDLAALAPQASDGARYAALLFDMDGTLLDSSAVVHRVWRDWAARHDLDPAPVLAAMPGVRAIETMARFGPPGIDVAAEAQALTDEETADMTGVIPIPGAGAFVALLPRDRWAVVTAAPRDLALRRMAAAGIPAPQVLICAEDVTCGKPDPEGYRAAARALGVDPADCVVLEDAAAGIAAARAAGAAVLVISAMHGEPMSGSHPMMVDFAAIEPVRDERGWIGILPRASYR